MKILLISINSEHENTGGGIYLRTISNLYKMCGYDVDVFSKGSKAFEIKKNIFTDLLGRIILCPSYIGFYIFKILFISKKYDVIAIHSSRLGIISNALRFFYPNKKIIMHSDNVETLLVTETVSRDRFLKKIVNRIDRFLIPIAEKLCAKSSTAITFITHEDRQENYKLGYLSENNKSHIIPVLLPDNIISNKLDKDNTVLFTGSFDFYPNQHAFYRIIEMAKFNDATFVVAGRNLNSFIESKKIEVPKNIKIFSDITTTQMDVLYQKSILFFCPVFYGSGMKTKIAEALSYNLNVIADQRSCYGYQDAIENKVVHLVDEMFFDNPQYNELDVLICNILNNNHFSKISSVQVFERFYNLNCGVDILKRVLK